MQKATHQDTKDHNARLVLRTLYNRSDLSRADIARLTHLTRPTVSTIVEGLMKEQYVLEVGQGRSAGGKRPTLLTVAKDAYHLIGIDLGSAEFRGAIINLRGNIVAQVSFPRLGCKGEQAIELVYTLLDSLLPKATAPLVGIGLGTPGLVDPQDGVIHQAVNLAWVQLPVRSLLEERYQKPVYVVNDSHAAALGEYSFGNERHRPNLVVIKVGQGIGAGVILNGELYYGDGYGAGEIGHVVVKENGVVCSCGNVGCLETIASTRAILAGLPAGTIWEQLVADFAAGQPTARQVVSEAANYLGLAVANLIGSLNIHHIILSGRIALFGDNFLNLIRQAIRRYVLPDMANKATLSFSALGPNLVMLGSSAMLLKHELGII